MTFVRFMVENARWLAGGFLLTLFSAFGQTYFISLSAGDIRSEYGLSHGEFGMIYMTATLASAVSLTWVGRLVDRFSPFQVTLIIVPLLAAGSVAMAFSRHVLALVLVIYVLRLFGQGMMTQNALTATARWFAANRGRAVSLVALGQNAGEAMFPFIFVMAAGLIGWRMAWVAGAGLLLLVAMPAIAALYRQERKPRASDPEPKVTAPREWTRGEVARDPLFWLMLAGVMAPPFIGTTIFFHQVYLVELRGWSLDSFAASFVLMSAMTIVFALVSGALIDRFTAVRMLPGFLIPISVACIVLALVPAGWAPFAFMSLLGVSNGFSGTLVGALWPEIYGVRHLGAIRSFIVAFMVLSTAVGPGVTGALIDLGVSYPGQILVMGIYCIGASIVLLLASRRVRARNAALAAGSLQ
ncbi:MFS transporter [Oricola thermophila]|uniref:MFS transporter n=1 Tax=Oricola thermophila TaxID=2742145 RepID=A0A6N1V9P0_9HYPH|nr:MFS transporter [Oricola thermophila]QKV17666.1 MFS transporter [Oricola thermophila]